KPVKEKVEKPTKEKKEKPVKEKVEKPAKEKKEKPVKEKVEKPTKEKKEKPVKEKVEKPTKEKKEKPVKEKVEKPIKEKNKKKNKREFEDLDEEFMKNDNSFDEFDDDNDSQYDETDDFNNEDESKKNEEKEVKEKRKSFIGSFFRHIFSNFKPLNLLLVLIIGGIAIYYIYQYNSEVDKDFYIRMGIVIASTLVAFIITDILIILYKRKTAKDVADLTSKVLEQLDFYDEPRKKNKKIKKNDSSCIEYAFLLAVTVSLILVYYFVDFSGDKINDKVIPLTIICVIFVSIIVFVTLFIVLVNKHSTKKAKSFVPKVFVNKKYSFLFENFRIFNLIIAIIFSVILTLFFVKYETATLLYSFIIPLIMAALSGIILFVLLELIWSVLFPIIMYMKPETVYVTNYVYNENEVFEIPVIHKNHADEYLFGDENQENEDESHNYLGVSNINLKENVEDYKDVVFPVDHQYIKKSIDNKDGSKTITIYNYSFQAMLSVISPDLLNIYLELKNYILSRNNTHSVIEWTNESFYLNENKIISILLSENSILVKIVSKKVNSTVKYIDYNISNHDDLENLENALIELLDNNAEKENYQKVELDLNEYTIEQLLNDKLIYIVYQENILPNNIPVEETKVIEIQDEEEEEEEDEEEVEEDSKEEIHEELEEENDIIVEGTHSGFNSPKILFKRSFLSKLCQLDEETQDFYSQVKNKLLSYQKVNSRVSWNFDTFNFGRKQLVKITVRGKTLSLSLALNPNEFIESKYYFQDRSDQTKFIHVPMRIKVKSKRGLKYAIELIDIMMEKNEIKEKFIHDYIDYKLPYKSDKKLIAENLIKVLE
ncbi:MAG: hypothetical protein ACRC5M_00025, partial [Anaeroplasmataceae bacterium]